VGTTKNNMAVVTEDYMSRLKSECSFKCIWRSYKNAQIPSSDAESRDLGTNFGCIWLCIRMPFTYKLTQLYIYKSKCMIS